MTASRRSRRPAQRPTRTRFLVALTSLPLLAACSHTNAQGWQATHDVLAAAITDRAKPVAVVLASPSQAGLWVVDGDLLVGGKLRPQEATTQAHRRVPGMAPADFPLDAALERARRELEACPRGDDGRATLSAVTGRVLLTSISCDGASTTSAWLDDHRLEPVPGLRDAASLLSVWQDFGAVRGVVTEVFWDDQRVGVHLRDTSPNESCYNTFVRHAGLDGPVAVDAFCLGDAFDVDRKPLDLSSLAAARVAGALADVPSDATVSLYDKGDGPVLDWHGPSGSGVVEL